METGLNFYNLTAAPNGDFIIGDDYSVERITKFGVREPIPSPIQMDMIQFKKWTGDKL